MKTNCWFSGSYVGALIVQIEVDGALIPAAFVFESHPERCSPPSAFYGAVRMSYERDRSWGAIVTGPAIEVFKRERPVGAGHTCLAFFVRVADFIFNSAADGLGGGLAMFSGKRADRDGCAVIIRAFLTGNVGTRK